MKNFKIYSVLGMALLLAACSHGDRNRVEDLGLLSSKTADAGKLNFMNSKVVVGADGKLSLKEADFNGSATGRSGYDAGMNAIKNGKNVNPAFAAVKGYDNHDGSVSVYLRDPSAAGWEYQTFGQVIDNTTGKSAGFVNIGQVYTPADAAEINASYHGVAMGVHNGTSEVIANMHADLAWGAAGKILEVRVTDSMKSPNNIGNRYNPIVAASELDFSDQLTWDGSKFSSNTAQAHLYGEAKEMGGTFSREVNGATYQGGFAGKQ